MGKYIIAIDQSTQGTKALLFDKNANRIARADLSHKQKISREGYISHDPEEIYRNTIEVISQLLKKTELSGEQLAGIGISNQRETTLAWDAKTGKAVCDAIVWQCARAETECSTSIRKEEQYIKEATGIPLSPYFPAAKMKWILSNCKEAGELSREGRLRMGTIDSWLLFKLTGGKEFKTDYSNASRTQLFNIHTLSWDKNICNLFQIPIECLPKVCDSNSLFGFTKLDGILEKEVPIGAILGDSHGALYGQYCHNKGDVKATYGTGSSLMMNVGTSYLKSEYGLVTSLGWGIDGKVTYVLEGNLNYTGAVITWLKEDLKLITSAKETEECVYLAKKEDTTYLIPAFSGLGAPYWKSEAKAMLYGMKRGTGKNEIIKAGVECIGYQITDLLKAMEADIQSKIIKICVDGGPTENKYLMQFQSDMANVTVFVPDEQELSAIGVAYLLGISMGIYQEASAFSKMKYQEYMPKMDESQRISHYQGWQQAVSKVIT